MCGCVGVCVCGSGSVDVCVGVRDELGLTWHGWDWHDLVWHDSA